MGWQQYAAAWADQHGGYDLRRSPPSVRMWLRSGYTVGRGLAALRVSAGAVFSVAVLAAAAVPVAAASTTSGPFGLLAAAGLAAVSAFVVVVDRALAVLRSRSLPRTAIRTQLAARVGEVGWLLGFWAVGVPGPLLVACGVLTGLYDLARQEAVTGGMSRVGTRTVAERPMRVTVAVAGFTLAGLVAALLGRRFAAGLLAVAAVFWLALAVLGAVQLATAVRKSFR